MNNCYGEKLITLATAIAIQISQDKTADDLAILGTLLTVIGDQVGLLSLTKQNCTENKEN